MKSPVAFCGRKKSGKSTLAAAAPSPIFLCAEDGISHLDAQRFPTPESWQDVLDAVAQLTTDAIADAGLVGGKIEFGHGRAPQGSKGRPD